VFTVGCCRWLLRTVSKCLRAWTIYVTRRHVQRECGKLADHAGAESDDEPDDGPPPPQGVLAETVSSVAAAVSAIPGYF
jgi:hypothetical protein